MKFGDFAYKVDACKVALFARAWIEIIRKSENDWSLTVALFARAWIEIAVSFATSSGTFVALFARAWIEIVCRCQNGIFCLVALFARAWIEITLPKGRGQYVASPSLRGRGLKSRYILAVGHTVVSRPLCEGVD